jgi:hypothetical protein
MKNNKIWCEHIKYWHRKSQKNVLTFIGLEDFTEASGWSYVYNNLVGTDKWNFCPICGVRKPN